MECFPAAYYVWVTLMLWLKCVYMHVLNEEPAPELIIGYNNYQLYCLCFCHSVWNAHAAIMHCFEKDFFLSRYIRKIRCDASAFFFGCVDHGPTTALLEFSITQPDCGLYPKLLVCRQMSVLSVTPATKHRTVDLQAYYSAPCGWVCSIFCI